MDNGSVVIARPIWGSQVLREPLQPLNLGIEGEDAFGGRTHPPVMVQNSLISWSSRRQTGSAARKVGGYESTFNPTPTSNGNRRTRSFYDIFYERIHFDPAALNLGQLLNAQTRNINVWNAFFENRTLTDVAQLDTDGLELSYGGTPQTWRPLQEKTFRLSVSTDGPPSIRAFYTFTWDNSVTVYRVIGERIVVFAFAPDLAEDFTERLTFYGTIFAAYSGKEQRMALTDHPRISYEFKIQVVDNERQRFESLMWGWQSRVFAVPVWNSFTYTSEPVAPGAFVVRVQSTAYREFKPEGLAIIAAGPALFEAVEILEVHPDYLLLKKPTAFGWTRRVQVMPVRTMRMAKEISYTGPVANFKDVRLQFTADSQEVLQSVAWPWIYDGAPVLVASPDMTPGISGSYTRNIEVTDGEYSLPVILDKSGIGTPHQIWSYVFTSFAEAQQFKSLLQSLRGACGEFWVSTWSPDITLASDIDVDSFSFYAEEAYHSVMYTNRKGRDRIAISLRDGTVFYRKIISVTNAVDSLPGAEHFILDEGIPRGIRKRDVACISYLTRSRFENENFEIKWQMQDWATLNVQIKGLTDAL